MIGALTRLVPALTDQATTLGPDGALARLDQPRCTSAALPHLVAESWSRMARSRSSTLGEGLGCTPGSDSSNALGEPLGPAQRGELPHKAVCLRGEVVKPVDNDVGHVVITDLCVRQ